MTELFNEADVVSCTS